MKKIYAVAHTHWDYEWYFTRQEARVQFAFHMDEVLKALEENHLNYYVLDGQSSILEDYLLSFPEKRNKVKEFVSAGRLFTGPWYTQIDEMITSGESIIRNLRLGMQFANELGDTMKIGYLPDSFGQGQDMPKIYNGFGIKHALFWRGLPAGTNARYFYWTSNDGSKVLTANIKNGYSAGADLIEKEDFLELAERISTETEVSRLMLPVGGDQRPVDFNFKERIKLANESIDNSYEFIESNYNEFFSDLEKEMDNLPTLSGEFIDPSDSKIHRGIYSSRYDLKQIYDKLERQMTYQVEPLSALALHQGIENKQGIIDEVWKTIARGQAHDSSGGCNTDKTNQDILNRGINAAQLSQSLLDYLLRKLSISVESEQVIDLFAWNPLPIDVSEIREFEITTKKPDFSLTDTKGNSVPFDVIKQDRENAGTLRRNIEEMQNDYYYVTTIALYTTIPATDWTGYIINEDLQVEEDKPVQLVPTETIENEYYKLTYRSGEIDLFSKTKHLWYKNFLTIEDSGDEGDTYDYSPAFNDLILDLDFSKVENKQIEKGSLVSRMILKGEWDIPYDLKERESKEYNGKVSYTLELKLAKASNVIDFKLKLDNQALDHRMRLLLHTDIKAANSYADTPFGVIERPVEDKHLYDWKEIGYREEPTSMRPMIHFANTHSKDSSWTFITQGTKDFQLIGKEFENLAITLFRGVGFLGRPDLLRRPSDASGLQTTIVPTPESQLRGELLFEGGIVIEEEFDSQDIQNKHLSLSQKKLFYQNQEINRFTTPIQYFSVNPNEKAIHNPIMNIKDLKAVFSSFQVSNDKRGFEIRVYNPTNRKINNPGTIVLKKPTSVFELDFNGKIQKTLESSITTFDMEPFKSGEIRTYGLFPER
ncbi:MAG: alpha-mannosidase [Pisciglobus halotolerans]|nr:alpha-mannosidase [Pisciglobus halotolerans]